MKDEWTHPGAYVRSSVLPVGMTVTEAARRLRIGRPALSAFLNGRASLSPQLANRIEAVFGAPEKTLLQMQAEHDFASRAVGRPDVGPYVPPFLNVDYRQIENWSSGIDARSQLPVLVRTLVRSTGRGLVGLDFPGNDASQSPGWDGRVEATEATPWVPLGASVWELSCRNDPRRKATDDYTTRTHHVKEVDRKRLTFVFVTPRRWPRKANWVEERNAEREWKEVRAYDACDLEQWLEHSIVGQLWFADTTGQPTAGLVSLGKCWRRWQADCSPSLQTCLFDEALSRSRGVVEQWLKGSHATGLSIAADSKEEALAFLYALFHTKSGSLDAMEEKVVVFEQHELLSHLLRPGTDLIPVITSKESEREFALHSNHSKAIFIRNRMDSESDCDITLEPLSYGAFCSALKLMGCDHQAIERHRRESGRSLTVLRRRLSTLPAVQMPEWVSDPKLTRMMAPIALVGSWDCDSEFDRLFLATMAGDRTAEEIEEHFRLLLFRDDPPVQWIGSHRGVVSRVDALFLVRSLLTRDLVDRFLEVAAIVLSEDNPALDLPEEEQWLANLYGKTRECSHALRIGIAETLVLLSVFADELFRDRPGSDVQCRVDGLIRRLLDPFTGRALESQSQYLPFYAEAAPHTLLDLIERDLDPSGAQEVLGLFRPVQSETAKCPRMGLLEALEKLAWSPDTVTRAIDVLASLSLRPINDLWAKTPETCIEAIFRPELPQTSVGVAERIQLFERLARAAPEVAWRLSCNQFHRGLSLCEHSAKPRWQKDSASFEQTANHGDIERFKACCCTHLLTRDRYSKEQLADLVGLLRSIPGRHCAAVWKLIDRWASHADERDKAWLRDKIRNEWLRYRPALRRTQPGDQQNIKRAHSAYASLEPTDPVLKYQWIFCDLQWLDKHNVALDPILERDQLASSAVSAAVAEIYSQVGIDGILRLASCVDGHDLVVRQLPSLGLCVDDYVNLVRLAVEGGLGGSCDGFVRMLLADLPDTRRSELYSQLKCCLSPEGVRDLLLLAPFRRDTWLLVEKLGDNCAKEYWRQVDPRRGRLDPAQFGEAIDRLMDAGRIPCALYLAAQCLKTIDPQQLYRVLGSVADYTGDDRERLFANDWSTEHLGRAIARIRDSRQISDQRIAVLELCLFEPLLDYGGYTPALDSFLARDARLFALLVNCASRIDETEGDVNTGDLGDGPVRVNNWVARLVLQKKRFLPGGGEHESGSAQRLSAWIRQARELCARHGNREEGDYMIGRLLASADTGDDGIWPCQPARDALEEISNDAVNGGFRSRVFGSTGFQVSGSLALAEQERATQYAVWSKKLQYSHPKVSRVLCQIAKEYEDHSRAVNTGETLQDNLINSI